MIFNLIKVGKMCCAMFYQDYKYRTISGIITDILLVICYILVIHYCNDVTFVMCYS